MDWVVGSAYAAINFSYEVAKALGAIHGFVEKDPSDPAGKKIIRQRRQIHAGDRVLQVEELIATGEIIFRVRETIEKDNKIRLTPINIVSLIEKEIWAVPSEDCSFCKAGFPRLRSKTHWRDLAGKV